MIYAVVALSILVFFLIVGSFFQRRKVNRLLTAIADTNTSLNETRAMVAKQEKALKRSGLYQNR